MRRIALMFSLLFVVVVLLLPSAGAQTTALHFASRYNGAASDEHTLTAASGDAFGVSGFDGNTVRFNVSDGNAAYSLTFTAPAGTPLAVGDAYGTLTHATAAAPGFTFYFNGYYGGPDDHYPGQFKVLEITSDANGNLVSFAADFVQHTIGDNTTVSGQLRYHAQTPLVPAAGDAELLVSHYRVLAVDGKLTVTVSRHDGSAGPLSVDYAAADATDLAGRDYAATGGTLTWADGDIADKTFTIPILDSGNPAQGDGTLLVNLDGPGAGPQTRAAVTVIHNDSAITFLHFESDAGAFYGGGTERTFNIAGRFTTSARRELRDGSVNFGVDNSNDVPFGQSENYALSLNAPTGTPIGVGDYQGTNEYQFLQPNTHPGLTFDGNGSGGNAQTGNFQVLEAEFDAQGNVLRFAANFEVHTLGQQAGVYGQVRYRSTVPLPPPRPTSVTVSTETSQISAKGYTAGVFTFSRSGNDLSAPMIVDYRVVGTAVSGVDYRPIKAHKKIRAGQRTVRLMFWPINHPAAGGANRTVKIKVTPQDGSYAAVGKGSAKVTLIQ